MRNSGSFKTLFNATMALLLSALAYPVQAQLVVDDAPTPTDLVQNVLLGNGVVASNITFTGSLNAIGGFDGTMSNLGIDSGLVMTTGELVGINGPVGPNNSGSSGTDNGEPNDPDLDIVAGIGTFNAAVLEFDFIPTGDTLRFNYVFGSEEYMEFVNAGVNDAFGFFLSGPGIAGPYSNGAENIALIPGTTTPVTIDNVNANLNGTYYVDNETVPGQTVQYDGFTTVLTAEAIVQCGEEYHIKIAIADAGDGVWDSGVFLEAQSFGSSGVNVTAATLDGDTIMTEGCGGAVFEFFRPDTTQDFTIYFTVGGSATMGSDFTNIPDSIVIPAGSFSDSLVVDAFLDSIPEGIETINITIDFLSGCGGDTIEATIYIQNIEPLVALSGGTDTICSATGEFATLLGNAQGGLAPYYFEWSNGGGPGQNVDVNPNETTNYFLTVTDACFNTAVSDPIEIFIQCPVLVPNVFTPNGDAFNEFFHISNIEQYPGNTLIIKNRWGNTVYETTNYLNDWNGDDLAAGTYYYIITTPDPDQGPFTGHVTILREK